MIPSFYRSKCLLPFTMHTNGYREYQEEINRPEGLDLYTQFTLCVGGEGELTDDCGKVHRIQKGDIFYFVPNTPHSYRNISDKWSLKYILISGEEATILMQRLGYSRCGIIHADEKAYGKLLEIWNMVDIHHTDSTDKKTIAQLSLVCYRTIVEIATYLNEKTDKERKKARERLYPVVSEIGMRYGEDITLEYLSGLINVTPTYLCRLFKTAYNTSPVSYITMLRLENSRQMLQGQKSITIKEIAVKCGFSDSSYFGKVFRKAFGTTPEQFRQNSTY